MALPLHTGMESLIQSKDPIELEIQPQLQSILSRFQKSSPGVR